MTWKICENISKQSLGTEYHNLSLKQKILMHLKRCVETPFELVATAEIFLKNRLWTRYIETRDAGIYRKYKSVRNAVRNATRKLQKDEQKKVAMQCKKNPKIFWKYINSKRQIHDHIGDFDKDGNMRTACTDSDKAEALGNFFAGIFNRESEFVEATAQPRPCQFSSQDPDISEQIILKKLNDLNVTKSPGLETFTHVYCMKLN